MIKKYIKLIAFVQKQISENECYFFNIFSYNRKKDTCTCLLHEYNIIYCVHIKLLYIFQITIKNCCMKYYIYFIK